MNSSSLSPLKNKSTIKQKSPSTLPPIGTSQTLKYHNDYQSYEDDLHDFKNQQRQQLPAQEDSVSKNSSIFSSSLSSSRKSDINQREPKPSAQIIKSQSSKVQTSAKKIVPYEQSPNFWNKSQQKPYIQYSQKDEYRNKSVQDIEREIKKMRKDLQEMNNRLSEQLNEYKMAKTEFTPKELLQPSKGEFYQVQIETNRKVQQAQLAQIKKLNQTEVLIKDKDVLIDLQNILTQMRQQIHHGKKQQHDSRLKNHKKDLFLDEIIKVNSDNKDNNAVKLLKLQIIYYMKRQNSLKIYEEQLDHQQKLIRQNDKNLQAKVQDMKKQHKLYHLCDENHTKLVDKNGELVDNKKLLQKHIQTIKRSNQIQQEKLAREIFQIDTLINKTIQPKIISSQETSQQIQRKINALTTAYQLNQSNLKNIKYKFLQDSINPHKNLSKQISKPFNKSTLKPTLRPKSKIQQSSLLLTQTKQQNTKSNQKLTSQRYNDKNVSMTIDHNLQHDSRFRSISQGLTNLKPKNFRIFTKRQQQNISQLDKHTSFSTIDYGPDSTKSIDKATEVQTARHLKPNLLLSKANTKR